MAISFTRTDVRGVVAPRKEVRTITAMTQTREERKRVEQNRLVACEPQLARNDAKRGLRIMVRVERLAGPYSSGHHGRPSRGSRITTLGGRKRVKEGMTSDAAEGRRGSSAADGVFWGGG